MVDDAWVSELERRAAPLRVALPPWGEVLARETWHVPPAERVAPSKRWTIAAVAFAAAAGIGLVWWDRAEAPAVPSVVVHDDAIADAPVAAPVPVPELVIELGPPPPPPPTALPKPTPPLTKPPKPRRKSRSVPAELDVDCILDPRLCAPAKAQPPPADPLSSGPTVDCILDPSLCSPPKPPPPPRSELPLTLGTAAVKAGITPIKPDVKRCGQNHGFVPGTRVIVKFTIAGATGGVTQAAIQSPLPVAAAFAGCVVAAVRRAVFRRFEKSSLGVVYPFTM